jgi:putative SOS response-associated peptidase YedK
MCSRYSLTAPPEAVRTYFGLKTVDPFPPRYNIAPTQPVAIVRDSHAHERELVLVRWGLIPSWVKVPAEHTTLINARAETAAGKPSFRGAMRHRRCLVPVTGFYEWTGAKGRRRPHHIAPTGGGLMAFAGLWENWLGADGSEIETMAILTVTANRAVGRLHDRMPAIIAPPDFDAWLDCGAGTAEGTAALLAPAPDDALMIVEVSSRLNDWRYDGADLLKLIGPPLTAETQPTLF